MVSLTQKGCYYEKISDIRYGIYSTFEVLLHPSIQEDMFRLDNKTISNIPEYKLRKITDTIDWQEQQHLWQGLLANSSK